MPETKRYKARSMMFASDAESARLSIVTECGEHLTVEITPTQAALINKLSAAYVADNCVATSKNI